MSRSLSPLRYSPRPLRSSRQRCRCWISSPATALSSSRPAAHLASGTTISSSWPSIYKALRNGSSPKAIGLTSQLLMPLSTTSTPRVARPKTSTCAKHASASTVLRPSTLSLAPRSTNLNHASPITPAPSAASWPIRQQRQRRRASRWRRQCLASQPSSKLVNSWPCSAPRPVMTASDTTASASRSRWMALSLKAQSGSTCRWPSRVTRSPRSLPLTA